ncbi:hypothetical protein WDU94_002658, partial [Cyamophila willieti]
TGGDKGGEKVGGGKEKKSNAFYTSGSEEESDSDEEEEESGSEEEEEESSGSEEESSSDEDDSSDNSESDSEESEEDSRPTAKNKKQSSGVTKKPAVPTNKNSNKTKATPSSQSKTSTKLSNQSGASKKTPSETARSNVDLLLDLDDLSLGGAPAMMATPTLGGFLSPLTPMSGNQASSTDGITPLAPSYTTVRYTEVLNRISQGHGMLSVQAAYTRGPCLASPRMITVSLRLTNHSSVGLNRLRLDSETASLGHGMSLQP